MSRFLIVPHAAPARRLERVAFLGPAGRRGGAGRPARPGKPAGDADEDDRPPVCPVCHKRLVILAMHPGRAPDGRPIRRQLWGCPRGHATVYRVDGVFGPLELLEDLDDE